MPRLTIDNREIEVASGTTVLSAARGLGIDIPALCFMEGFEPSTSCMVCLVKDVSTGELVPSCATEARDGMCVESETEEVLTARRTALELLLSDHLGDCEAPCRLACPARMNIPLMLRHIAAGRFAEAISVVKDHIALPAVLGRICPAPCEKACRRGHHDQPVSICLLKRFAADVDLAAQEPHLPPREPESGKRVAIVGAGPAGLAAAYYLHRRGHACTLIDAGGRPGGALREVDSLDADVLDAEIATILALGVELRMNARIDTRDEMEDLRRRFDAVLLAFGEASPERVEALGIRASDRGIETVAGTYETSLPGVFAAGDCIRRRRLAVRALADGRQSAVAIDQRLRGGTVTGQPRCFSTHVGKLTDEEMDRYLAGADESGRVEPADAASGLGDEEARREATRCLHCDCRKADACKLRDYSAACGASPRHFRGHPVFEQYSEHPEIIYEPGKCISCGLCTQVARRAGEDLGLTFVGRGFDVKVAVPFGESIEAGLKTSARECVRACPTGALALKDA